LAVEAIKNPPKNVNMATNADVANFLDIVF
jgi:hypothetical protein